MTKGIGHRRHLQLIQDMLHAEHDVLALAERYRLKPSDLAEWAIEPEHHRVLRGLCVLADLQTQLVLSRYRRLAAGRLIRLATDESDEKTAEVARKACVDLLRADMKRADAPPQAAVAAVKALAETNGPTDDDTHHAAADLRAMFYADDDEPDRAADIALDVEPD